MIKKYFSIFLFLPLLLFSASRLLAQEENVGLTGRYFNPEAGVSLSKLYDESFSLLKYAGPTFSGGGGFLFRNNQHLHHVDLLFDYGFLSNDANNSTLTQYQLTTNYSYNKYLKDLPFFFGDHLQWFVGGSVNSLWMLSSHGSFSNNAVTNNFYLSLSPSTNFFYDFELWNQKFVANVSAFLPIFTFAVRPAYGSSRFSGGLDESNDLSGFLESGSFASFNKYFRFSASYNLEYHLKNANALRLRYMWNYYSFKQDDRVVKGAAHTITFSTMFGF